jgi:serine/threonine protein kinase
MPGWLEALTLVGAGAFLGGFLCLRRRLAAAGFAAGFAILVALGAVLGSRDTNLWFPWLIIAGGQVPCALGWALLARRPHAEASVVAPPADRLPPGIEPARAALERLPEAPDYELINPPFGRGAYGKVWLARNAVGQWQALKAVYLANFGDNHDPFEREFNGIRRYKPVSDKHPGLLRVDFVSHKRDGYFYYVMELGDSLEPGWEKDPATYKPRDLASVRSRSPQHRLPIAECLRIGLALTEALDFLHRQGLTHRDIKPQNIILVNGHPKLADVGLISDIRPPGDERTFVGTPGYMPPFPERPGTPQADIYALGMVLYVLATGRNSSLFPEIATTLAENQHSAEFFALNSVILSACQPDCSMRYSTAAEMHLALVKVQATFKQP